MNLLKNIFKGLFKTDFEAKDSEIASLQQSILNFENVSKNKENQIIRLEADAESLKREIDERDINIYDLNDELAASQRQLAVTRNDYDREHKIRIDLETQIDSFRQKESQAQEQVKKRDNELKSVRQEADSLKLEISKLKDENKTLQNKHENNQKTYINEITTLKTENKNLSNIITTLEHERELLKIASIENSQTIENLEKTLSAINEENKVKVSELKTQLEIANQSLRENLSCIDDLNDTIRTIQNEAKEKLSSLTASLDNSQKALDSKTQECENLKCQLKSANNADSETLTALKADISSKREEISSLELTIQKLNESISDLRTTNETLEIDLRKKDEECSNLKSSLESLSKTSSHALETERLLSEAMNEIGSLNARIQTLPSESELTKRDKEIERLNLKIRELESKIKSGQSSPKELPKPEEPGSSIAQCPIQQKSPRQKPVYKKPIMPYIQEPVTTLVGEILKKKNFPKIENDNVYAPSQRLIDEVFNCRTGNLVSANSIFLKWTAEEISHLRFELEEAVRKNEPYLICPCCRQMVKISSRSIGFGKDSREVQYFTHAVKNIPCDLKRDYTYDVSIDGVEIGILDRPDYLKNLRSEIYDALTSNISSAKGISDVKVTDWILSDELPIMKRRLADITASYNKHDIVFELVTPTTNSSKLHDRDIFYLINKRQVFWILGLNSKANYDELRRSVAKDIMFTNRRNVFVFDIDAQEETRKRGELILKCNWLDENGDWYYQVEKNGKNGIFISLDQITFEEDSCRPYFYDADEPYFLKHPSAERPPRLSREDLKKSIIDRWSYGEAIDKAKKEMAKSGIGVEAFFDGKKWGFRYGALVFIEPRFTEEPIIQGNFAKVCMDGKFGIVDRIGNTIIQPSFAFVEILPDDWILYSDKNEWHIFGIIDSIASYDSKDTLRVEMVSDDSKVFRLIINKRLFSGQLPEEFYFSGKQIFKKDKLLNKWTLWCSNGVKLNEASWDSIEVTDEFQLKLINENKVTLLARDGSVTEETIIKQRDYLLHEPLENGNFLVKDLRGFWGIVDDQDNNVVHPQYDIIEKMDNNHLRFLSKGKWGVMDIDGNVEIEAKYKTIDSVGEKGFIVSTPNPEKPWEVLHGKIDWNGNEIREIISELPNGMYIFKSFERYGIESSNGVILKHTYQSLTHWDKSKFIAKKNDTYGIIDINGIVILPFEYTQISPLKDNRAIVCKGSKNIHINSECKIIEDEIITLQEGYKKIKKEGKWGIISPDGKELVLCKYDEITTFRGRLIGIINGQLVKLAAYYPFLLQMSGIYNKISGKDLVQVSTFMFRLCPKVSNIDLQAKISVALINWTNDMQYPIVTLALPGKLTKKRDFVDRNESYLIGENIKGQITSYKKQKNKKTNKSKYKYADIMTTSGAKVRVHSGDFIRSQIPLNLNTIGTTLSLTKIGYNEELDRTIWRVTILDQK